MRKSTKLMAGLGVVAGLGVAMAPLATFAEEAAGSHNLKVNVTSECTLDATDAAFSGEWAGTTSVNTGETVALAGNSADNQITFNCNENSKVDIFAQATALTAADANNATIAVTNVQANYSVDGMAGMTLETDWASGLHAFAGTDTVKIAHGVAPATGSFGIKVAGYSVVVPEQQKAGTYTGTVTYTFDNVDYNN